MDCGTVPVAAVQSVLHSMFDSPVNSLKCRTAPNLHLHSVLPTIVCGKGAIFVLPQLALAGRGARGLGKPFRGQPTRILCTSSLMSSRALFSSELSN